MSTLTSTVAISVSNPGEEELVARGLMDEHIRHAFVETARQVLAAGGALAYGGDLRRGGFTETLRALLRTYSDAARPAVERVRQYMARPVWSQMSESEQADISNYFTIVKVEGAGDVAEGQLGRARDFTAMRARMTAETDARIVIGGRPTASEGRWPGVVEEAAVNR
jgi:SLOG cluster2